jgi:hypothetical protein
VTDLQYTPNGHPIAADDTAVYFAVLAEVVDGDAGNKRRILKLAK